MKLAVVYLLPLLLLLLASGCGGSSAANLEGNGDNTIQPLSDTEAPRITSFTGVANGSLIAGLVHVAVSADDNNGVVALKLLANDSQLTSATGSPLAYDWDTTVVDPGMYVLTAIASDAAGNEGRDSLYVYVTAGASGDDDQTVDDPSDPADSETGGEETETNDNGATGDQTPVDTGDPITAPIPGATQPELIETEPVDSEIDVELPEIEDPETPTGGVPGLIISNLVEGQIIYGQHYFSAFGFSEIGIDAIVLLIDEVQVAAVQDISLGYSWDTQAYADGLHEVAYVVRDRSGTFGILKIQVTIDNVTDYLPPVLTIEDSYWECNGLTGPIEVICCGTYAFTAADRTYLIFEVMDSSEIDYFEVIFGDYPKVVADEPQVEIALDSEYWETHDSVQEIYLTARDEHGNEATRHVTLERQQTISVAGDCPNHDGELIYGVNVYLLAGAIPDPANCDPEQAIDVKVLDEEKGFWFRDLQVGVYTVYFQYDGLEACQVTEAGPGLYGVDPNGFVYKPIS
ncbi:hypothetical protein JW859_09405 [bacterium]|nr:hypothetical protein [bacterium]